MGRSSSNTVARGGLAAVATSLALFVVACQPATREQARVELAVPFKVQETLLCVPTSASIVLAFYGDEQSPRRLKMLSRGIEYRPGEPFQDYSITPYASLVRGLTRVGYRWGVLDFPMTPDGFDQGLTQIKDDLRGGHPALVDISHNGIGHTLVVAGFDDQRGLISFVDPSAPSPGRVTATYAQFEAVWNETAYGDRFRAMIRTKRKGE